MLLTGTLISFSLKRFRRLVESASLSPPSYSCNWLSLMFWSNPLIWKKERLSGSHMYLRFFALKNRISLTAWSQFSLVIIKFRINNISKSKVLKDTLIFLHVCAHLKLSTTLDRHKYVRLMVSDNLHLLHVVGCRDVLVVILESRSHIPTEVLLWVILESRSHYL